MKGEMKNGDRYALVQYDAVKDIDWFVDAFCHKKSAAQRCTGSGMISYWRLTPPPPGTLNSGAFVNKNVLNLIGESWKTSSKRLYVKRLLLFKLVNSSYFSGVTVFDVSGSDADVFSGVIEAFRWVLAAAWRILGVAHAGVVFARGIHIRMPKRFR